MVSEHRLNWVHSDSVRSLSYIHISHNTKGLWIFSVSDLDTWERCLYLWSGDTADHACLHILKPTNKQVSRFPVHSEARKKSCINISLLVSRYVLLGISKPDLKATSNMMDPLQGWETYSELLRHLMISGGLYINTALLLHFNNTELLW